MHTSTAIDNVLDIPSASAPGAGTRPAPAGGLAFQLELGDRSLVFRLVGPDDRHYGDAARLARVPCLRAYCATTAPWPHRFIVCVDLATGTAIACAGLSFAGRAPLLSEQYLDAPLEQVLDGVFQRRTARRDVAELTALATIEPRIGSELMRVLPLICWYLGLRGVLCTATSKLRRCFDAMQLRYHPLVAADPARLPVVRGVNWGTRHDSRPVMGVMRVDALGEFFDAVGCRYNRHLLAGDIVEGCENMMTATPMMEEEEGW